MNDGILVEVIDGAHETLFEFLLGGDEDVAEDRTGELGKEAFNEVEPGAVLGDEGEPESPPRLIRKPSFGLTRDVRGVIVQDEMDRRIGWVGAIQELKKLDEFPAAVAIFDQSMDLAAHKIDACEQADRAM